MDEGLLEVAETRQTFEEDFEPFIELRRKLARHLAGCGDGHHLPDRPQVALGRLVDELESDGLLDGDTPRPSIDGDVDFPADNPAEDRILCGPTEPNAGATAGIAAHALLETVRA